MKLRRRLMMKLKYGLLDIAHRPKTSAKMHDRLEHIAYHIIDPLIYL